MSEKNQEKKPQKKECDHFYFPSKSITSGGQMKVTEVRCAKCLKVVDLEKLQWVEGNE